MRERCFINIKMRDYSGTPLAIKALCQALLQGSAAPTWSHSMHDKMTAAAHHVVLNYDSLLLMQRQFSFFLYPLIYAALKLLVPDKRISQQLNISESAALQRIDLSANPRHD